MSKARLRFALIVWVSCLPQSHCPTHKQPPPERQMGHWDDVVKAVYKRWGSKDHPSLEKDDAAKILAISVGLSCLFNENWKAEKRWMNSTHNGFEGTPFEAVKKGRIDDVLAFVNRTRNL